MNPPHALLPRDYQRIGNAVMVTVAREQFPLSNNTHCVCRLITHVKCSCVHIIETSENPKKAESFPVESQDDDAALLKKKVLEVLHRIRHKHNILEASQRWGDATREALEMHDHIQTMQDLERSHWLNKYDLVDRNASIGPELMAMVDSRSRRKQKGLEAAKVTAMKAASKLVKAQDAYDTELAAKAESKRSLDQLREQERLEKLAQKVARRTDEIQRLQESLKLLKIANANNAATFAASEKNSALLDAMGAQALADEEARMAAAIDKAREEILAPEPEDQEEPADPNQEALDMLLAEVKAGQADLDKVKGDLASAKAPTPVKAGEAMPQIGALRGLLQKEQDALSKLQSQTSKPCIYALDCEMGEHCDEQSMMCATIVPGSKCNDNRQCGIGQDCVGAPGNRRCTEVTPKEGESCVQVLSDKDKKGAQLCGTGYSCSLNRCRVKPQGTHCRFHKECGLGQICSLTERRCQWMLPPPGTSCAATVHCALGMACMDGLCKLVRAGSPCTSDGCGNGMMCLAGACYMVDPPEGTACEETKNCGPGQVCDDGSCTVLFEGSRCETSAGCGYGQQCDRGLCHTVESKEACTSDSACGNGQRCLGGFCAGVAGTGEKCKAGSLGRSFCRLQQLCQSGYCVEVLPDTPCADSSTCGAGMKCTKHRCVVTQQPSKTCVVDTACGPRQWCLGGECTDVPFEYGSCKTDAGCGIGTRCSSSICMPSYSNGDSHSGMLCKTNEECANGQRCAGKRCMAVPYGGSCAASDPKSLGLNQKCNADQIAGDGAPCENIGGCGPWQACIGGMCSSLPAGSPCQWVEDCGNMQVCEDVPKRKGVRTCRGAPRGDGAECVFPKPNEDTDPKLLCSDGFECNEGSCAFVAIATPCDAAVTMDGNGEVTSAYNSGCGMGQRCVAGGCMWMNPPDGATCDEQIQCGHGQQCLPKKECLSILIGTQCGAGGEEAGYALCGNGQICRDGRCADVPQGTICEVAEAPDSVEKCGVYQKCTDAHKCLGAYHNVGIVLDGTPCVDDIQCGDSQMCGFGFCRTVAPGALCTNPGACGNGQQCSGRAKECIAFRLGDECKVDTDCGQNMRCLEKACMRAYGFDAMDLRQATPTYSKCFSHTDCAFGQYCQDGHCTPVLAGASCASNGDCGNGERCSPETSQCEVVKDNSKCRAVSDCANGQICDRGMCHGLYGRGIAAKVQEGAGCIVHADCGGMQRCDQLHCRRVPDTLQCAKTDACGNGQKCEHAGYCGPAREGMPCGTTVRTNDACGLSQACLEGLCRGQFGRMLDTELHRRAEEDWTMMNEWEHTVQARVINLEYQVKAELNTNASVGLSTAQAVLRLREERKRLESGRKTLEQELERRVEWATPSESKEWSSSFEQSEGDIEKLMEEVRRLQAELLQCRKKPAAYVPSCEQDLTFQINKLLEEIARRRAQLQGESQKVDDEAGRLQGGMAACLARPDGCPPDEMQNLKLQLMKAQQELARREGSSHEEDLLTIYKCLYKHSEDVTVKAAEKLVLDESLKNGCGAMIIPKNKKTVSPVLQECLCQSMNQEQKLAADSAAQAKQSEAVYNAEQREKKTEEEAETEAQTEAAALGEWKAKELIWHDEHLQSGYQDKLTNLQNQYRDELPEIWRKPATGGAEGDAPAKVFTEEEISQCILQAGIKEQETKEMINETFASSSAGNPTGCALLSLADNDLLQKFHSCLCIDK